MKRDRTALYCDSKLGQMSPALIQCLHLCHTSRTNPKGSSFSFPSSKLLEGSKVLHESTSSRCIPQVPSTGTQDPSFLQSQLLRPYINSIPQMFCRGKDDIKVPTTACICVIPLVAWMPFIFGACPSKQSPPILFLLPQPFRHKL